MKVMSFLPSFFSREVKIHDSFLGVDLGTGVVKVASFSLDERGVVLTGFGKIPYGKEVPIEKALAESLSQATLGMKKPPAEVILGLSGENVVGVSSQVRLKRGLNYTKPISSHEMGQLNHQGDKVALEEALEIFSEDWGIEITEIDILNSKVNNVFIDEKTVLEALGKTGRSVSLSQFSSFALSSYLGEIQKILKKVGLKVVTATSLNYALAEALALGNIAELNAILVDIGSLSTEVGLIYGRNLCFLRSFPLGSNAINRALISRGLAAEEGAEDLKQSLTKNSTAGATDHPTKQIVTNTVKMWVSGFASFLEECSQVSLFPSRIILTGGGSLLPQFKEALISYPFSNSLPFEAHPKINVLESSEVKGVYLSSGAIKVAPNFGVMALGLVGLQIKEKM